MPRPESAIHALPKTGPYQRKPMTIAAAVATMIAIQFTCPSSNARYVRAQANAEAPASRPRGRTRRTPHRIGTARFAPARGRGGSRARGRSAGRAFFFNNTATPEIYTLALHDALPQRP